MENIGYIEIRIKGSRGNLDLTPDNYDIREVVSIIETAENLLFQGEKKDRPLVSYKIEEGSVRHIFRTGIQAIIGFNAIIGSINSNQNIDFLNISTAKAIEVFQDTAVKKDYEFQISTSLPQTESIVINSTTHFVRNEHYWVDAEFYFYGKITNAGGKDKANIHLLTEEFGTIIIQTPQEFLAASKENLLYKSFGIRASGLQNSETGEIDKSSLRFDSLIDYNTTYNDRYIQNLRKQASAWLKDIDADKWLKEIRGYDA